MGAIMKRSVAMVFVINFILYLFFVLSVFSQGELFAQDYYSPSTLTRVKWGFTSITVQSFYWYSNGTVVPASGMKICPNYPAIIGLITMITNILFFIIFFGPKQKSRIERHGKR